ELAEQRDRRPRRDLDRAAAASRIPAEQATLPARAAGDQRDERGAGDRRAGESALAAEAAHAAVRAGAVREDRHDPEAAAATTTAGAHPILAAKPAAIGGPQNAGLREIDRAVDSDLTVGEDDQRQRADDVERRVPTEIELVHVDDHHRDV